MSDSRHDGAEPEYRQWSGRRVLVTGGAGFIGSTLVRALTAAGASVRVVDDLSRGRLENLLGKDGQWLVDPESDFVRVDLSRNDCCMEYVRDADVVYHLADVVGGVSYALTHEPFIFRQNILINSNVLHATIANGIRGYVYVGTACSFPQHLQRSDEPIPLVEDQTYPAWPESSYGWSKLLGEYEATLAGDSGLLDVGILRLHNVYGPGCRYDGDYAQALPSLIRKAVRYPEEDFVVWGSGNQYRDFLFVDDAVDALLRVFAYGMNQGVVQVASGRAVYIREAAEMVASLSGKALRPRFDTTRPEGDRGRIGSNDRAREVLGWEPQWSFESGLESTYAWVQRRIAGESNSRHYG